MPDAGRSGNTNDRFAVAPQRVVHCLLSRCGAYPSLSTKSPKRLQAQQNAHCLSAGAVRGFTMGSAVLG
jgi:hypothetical protein